jgi:hypothetical protein
VTLLTNTEAIESVNLGDGVPDEIEVEGDVLRLEYHSTDAWRGYWSAVAPDGSDWEPLDESGWMTGDYDDAPLEARSSSVEEKVERIAEAAEAEGYDVLVVFTPTSNVFSTSYDLFRRKR